jgi:glycosyltransferase involved in cell wall biosynthesis
MTTTKRLIFQLGTNNWQRGGEFAPGSGILHESHHRAYGEMADTASYSVYPSSIQTSDDPKVRVLELDHEVPICESISPVSSYRFHSMSDAEFKAYVDKLRLFTEQAIDDAEQAEGVPVSVAVAHHTFLNPLILSAINAEREAAGRPRFKLLCFVHGTALKMFAHELAGVDPEYPIRFLPMMRDAGVFAPSGGVDVCAAISAEQIDKFLDVYPGFPSDRVVLSPNGYSSASFKPDPAALADRTRLLRQTSVVASPAAGAPVGPGGDSERAIDGNVDKVVVFCGKFADWKRLDALLAAAADYERDKRLGRVATLIIGSGPDDAVEHYHRLAYETHGLQRTYFLGARPHDEIARFNAMADLGVYPSRNEPFGLVFIEAMACGTPVIGADSGGPRDFVTDEVGGLVPEAEGDELVRSLVAVISEALKRDWKSTKGPAAADYALANFSTRTQCDNLLLALDSRSSIMS